MARRKEPARYPLVEWVSAAIGLAITAGIFGFLFVEAAGDHNGVPPVMKAVPVAFLSVDGQYIVEVEVENRSPQTGASVSVEGALINGNEEVETSEAALAYVPGDSRRRAGLVFDQDPRDYRLRLRVTGYERP
ncbi:MAG: hypothetical protein ACLGHC_07035 [Alphaproteobacteria bacterium]